MRFKQQKTQQKSKQNPNKKQQQKRKLIFKGWFIPVIQLLKNVFEFPFENNWTEFPVLYILLICVMLFSTKQFSTYFPPWEVTAHFKSCHPCFLPCKLPVSSYFKTRNLT